MASSKTTILFTLIPTIVVILTIILQYKPGFLCNQVEPHSPKILKPYFYFCDGYESTYAMVKPDAVSTDKFRIISSTIHSHPSLFIEKKKKVWLTEEAIKELYSEHALRPFYKELVLYISSGPVIIMKLGGKNAIKKWREVIGPTDPAAAKLSSPSSLRAQIGNSKTINSLHGSDSLESAQRELNLLFSPTSHADVYSLPGKSLNNTILILFPSIRKSEEEIKLKLSFQGFEILKSKSFKLSSEQALDFWDSFKDTLESNKVEFLKELEEGELWMAMVQSEDALGRLSESLGHVSKNKSKKVNMLSLSSLYGNRIFSAKDEHQFNYLSKQFFEEVV